MHSFTFVPDSNRAPVPTHVKLGSGRTVPVREAFAGTASMQDNFRRVRELAYGVPGGTPLRACAECPDEPDREHRGPFPVPAPDRFSERNWPEPNNRYWCSCAVCSLAYFGPKRSHICWSCTPEKGPSA